MLLYEQQKHTQLYSESVTLLGLCALEGIICGAVAQTSSMHFRPPPPPSFS